MKWILILVLIVVIMLIAHSLSEQYKEKFDFYNNLKLFLNQFKINVSFKKTKILDFLQNIQAKKQFKLFINSYKNYLKSNNLELNEIKILDIEEKETLKNIICNLGNFDTTNELNQIEMFISDVEQKLIRAEADKNKLCPMIIKLSLLFAVALAILLI